MKFTVTRTFMAKRITCGELVKSGAMSGMFIEKDDVKPLWVWEAYSWIEANPKKVIYLLEDEEFTTCLK
jgi:hypothetical protein